MEKNGVSLWAVDVVLPDGDILSLDGGRSLLEISEDVKHYYQTPIVAALVDTELEELLNHPEGPATIRFLDLTTRDGVRIYQRSLILLLIHAVHELYPGIAIKIEHSLGKGLYCELDKNPPLSAADVVGIEQRMRQLVAENLPINKRKVTVAEAEEVFAREGFVDKILLLKYWPKDHLKLYSIGDSDLEDTLYGYHVPQTGILQILGLLYHAPGFVLCFPDESAPLGVCPFVPQPKLFEIFRESDKWGTILGFDTAGAMNSLIKKGEGLEVMRIAEALHEKKIAQIADMISERREGGGASLILIAGPSSSGKTTFAQRLRIQLLVNGMRPFPISMDDYFVDREFTPLDEDNKPDFEHIEAVDLALFNEHLQRLFDGEEVEIPHFNFSTGKREYRGSKVKLEKDQPLIVEGIHGLNERLTHAIPRDKKFKIYISALTALNIDKHTRIHTTDTRLLRRLVRDIQFRGVGARDTIKRWPSVRRGEERNIFNLQEEADIMFNSSLIYELAVIKNQIEPLLNQIKRAENEYIEAKRLLHLLSFFVPMDSHEVPSNSILREFIGNPEK